MGDFQEFSWNQINTPVPNDVYWGVRFRNLQGNLHVVGPRAGDTAQLGPSGATSDPEVMYVSTTGAEDGPFEEFNFTSGSTDLDDNLAVTILAVPEPRVLGLLLVGLAAILFLRRRRNAA